MWFSNNPKKHINGEIYRSRYKHAVLPNKPAKYSDCPISEKRSTASESSVNEEPDRFDPVNPWNNFDIDDTDDNDTKRNYLEFD